MKNGEISQLTHSREEASLSAFLAFLAAGDPRDL